MELEQSNLASTQATCIVCPPEPGDHDRMADLAGQLGYPGTGDQTRMGVIEMRDSNRYAIDVSLVSGVLFEGMTFSICSPMMAG
jgi:hypothetical protein